MESVRLTRAELYEAVWKTPMSKLAHKFGLSDVALAKTCRRMNVPKPPRGYWARVAAGERLTRPPLPKAGPKQEAGVYLRRVPEAARPTTVRPASPKVPIANTLEAAHPAVRDLGLALRNAKADEYGRLVVLGEREPVLAVTVNTHRRALLLLDALFKTLVARGHEVSFSRRTEGEGTIGKLMVIVGGDPIRASMMERLDRKDHVAKANEGKSADAGHSYAEPKYDYYAGGRLQLILQQVSVPRASWSDVKRSRLDQQLGHAILAIEAEAEARRRRREAEEQRRRAEVERQRQQEEEARRRREEEARLRHEELLAKDLRQMARNWGAAQEVRAFVSAVERAALGIEQRRDFVEWLRWASSYAARLDPLTRLSEIPKALEADLSNLG